MCDLNSPNSAPSTSRISLEPSLSGEYDVFLSFRGKDTRKGFTDFLYTYLQDAEVWTFRDNKELRVGEEIGPELTKAIENSKICIPIFSKNYAFSKWCMIELAHIVKCHAEAKRGEKKIFPIFYDVEPHDVRHQSGSYEEAFRQHEKNESLDVQTVRIWKEALAEVGRFKGFELEKETSGYEGELVKRTVKKCLDILKKHHKHVPLNVVGMENHIRELESLLEVDSNEVRIVGIHGTGGLGKTTMAKIIYNRLCQNFEAHCFVENIRENSNSQQKLVNLQSQILSEIQRRPVEQFNDFYEGCSRIKEVVRGRKLLIVLDDVDRKSQVDDLTGNLSGFGVQSRIIITTRDEGVLNSIKMGSQRDDPPCASYEPKLMDEFHSLQLFSKHAFCRDSPPKEYNILSKEVVSIASGLPLALKVLGSTFSEVKGIGLWEENVKKLRKNYNRKVVENLRFSFEALTDEQKEIFLDIACLFIGMDKRICSYMWEDCNFFPDVEIDVLIHKNFITIGSRNEFKMHDHLRHLGRFIVREENLKDLGKQSRLWRKKEAMHVLKTNQGTSSINALRLPGYVNSNSLPKISGSRLQDVANLRYLSLGPRDIDGDFEGLLSNLRWLEWDLDCDGNFVPKKLHMENLVVLDLSHSSLRYDWDGWIQIKFGKKLKHLDLSFCKGIRVLSNFSMCTSLESLNLSDSSIRRLGGIGLLEALKYLDASWCRNLEIISGLSNMSKLVHLELTGCSSLSEIQSLEKLESLQYLSIERCTSLRGLPDLSNLKMLKIFDGGCCAKLIEIVGLDKLESLENLYLGYCKSLERLPDVSKLKNLKRFEAQGCVKLIKVEGVHELNALERLDLRECISLKGIIDISHLNNLMYLGVSGLELEVKGSCLKKLKELEIKESEIHSRDEIQFSCGLESLETLVIADCPKLIKVQGLDKLQSLTSLNIKNCIKLIEIQGLDKLQSLISLNLQDCWHLECLSDLPNFRTLKTVKVENCCRLRDVAALGVVESLEELSISLCDVLREIPDLRCWKTLKKLEIIDVTELTGVHGLEDLKSLDSIEIKGCRSINFSNRREL